jgi:uncharacterized damage-inducible protein DinB
MERRVKERGMYELFSAMAEYNKNVNDIVSGYVGSLDRGRFERKFEAYYPSLPHTYFHVMSSDAKWLGRLSQFYLTDFDQQALSDFKKAWDAAPGYAFDSREAFLGFRRDLDVQILELIRNMEDIDLNTVVSIPLGGSQYETVIWRFLYQWFNHQTHHRGQIALQLDMMGIENDFSKVLDKIGK